MEEQTSAERKEELQYCWLMVRKKQLYLRLKVPSNQRY
jgi:hypothetical protein